MCIQLEGRYKDIYCISGYNDEENDENENNKSIEYYERNDYVLFEGDRGIDIGKIKNTFVYIISNILTLLF